MRHSSRGTVVRTREELKKDFQQYRRVLNAPESTIDDCAVVGDRVWSRVTSRGVNLETEQPRTITWLQVHRVEDGRFVETWVMYLNDVDWRESSGA